MRRAETEAILPSGRLKVERFVPLRIVGVTSITLIDLPTQFSKSASMRRS